MANAVIVGRVSIPEMERRGYDKSLAGGVVCAGGTLGSLIPPSIPMVFYALFSEQSLSKLFMSGIGPGILISLMMIIYILIHVKLNPSVAPPLEEVSLMEAIKKSYKLLPFLLLLIGMIAAFYVGIATPTEVAGLAAFAGFVLVLVYRRYKWEKFKKAVLNTIRTAVTLLWILIPAMAFGTVLAYGKFPENITNLVVNLPVDQWLIMLAINFFLLLLGCILETGAITMIFWPLLIIVAQGLGWNLILFAVILVIQIELGQITPPVGIVLFGMKAIAPEIEVKDLWRGVMPFVAIMCLALLIIIVFPQIALWIPSRM